MLPSNNNNFTLTSVAKINTSLDFLSNLTIICKDGEFKVNILCWASISEVFAAMLQTKMKEANNLVIELPLFSAVAIRQLYLAMFTGSSLTVEYILEYVHFAHLYNIPLVLESCKHKMLQLPPYQSFFTCSNQFNLDLYHNLLNNFLNINSYNTISIG